MLKDNEKDRASKSLPDVKSIEQRKLDFHFLRRNPVADRKFKVLMRTTIYCMSRLLYFQVTLGMLL